LVDAIHLRTGRHGCAAGGITLTNSLVQNHFAMARDQSNGAGQTPFIDFRL